MIFTECAENNEIIFNESKNNKRVDYIDKFNCNRSTVLSFSGNNGGSYMHDALYESYIQAKIDAEDRLAFALKENMVISEADYSNIRAIHEAKASEKIKVKWKKFIAFIKGLIAKFMESISNILLDEKEYLEKYKDIILNKKAKEELEYSYSGNYEMGINRLIATEVPLFDYDKFKDTLESDSDGPLVEKIMSGKSGFTYDDGETLAENFKRYFLALDEGQSEGTFDKLDMKTIYNFCYNFSKIEGIVNKDTNKIEASTRNIENMIKKELSDQQKGQETNTGEQKEEKKTGTGKPPIKTNATVDGKSVNATVVDANGNDVTESANKNKGTVFNEKVEIKEDKPSSDAVSKMTSTQNRDEDGEKTAASTAAASGKTENDLLNATAKWTRVCNAIVGAKLTACQQIAKDYMDIIRAHVRSYGGVDKKDKTGITTPGTGATYSKEKAKAAAEKAQKDAETEEQKVKQGN